MISPTIESWAGVGILDAAFVRYIRAFDHPMKLRIVRKIAWALFPYGVRVTHPQGGRLDLNPRDYIDWSILREGAYEPRTLFRAQSILRQNPGVFLDVGANIGLFSCVLGKLPNTSVVAIEPDARNFSRLQKHITGSGIRDAILVHSAADSEARLLRMGLAQSNNTGTMRVQLQGDTNSTHGFWVSSMQMEMILRTTKLPANPVSLLKIDVEGYEPQVLAGLNFEGPYRPNHILIEYSPATASRLWGSLSKFRQFFEERNYEGFDVSGNPIGGRDELPEENAWFSDRRLTRTKP